MVNAINILAAEAASGGSKGLPSWVMYVIIGVVLVLMIVLTIVPQKKRQKEQQKMMDAIVVGTKLMTVGGLVGKITQVNNDNTLIINVGTESSPTLIVIDKKAVGYVLEAVAPAPAPAVEATDEVKNDETPAEETPVEESVESTSPVEETPSEDAPVEDVPADEAPVEE